VTRVVALDYARPLAPGVDVLVEAWPRSGGSCWVVRWPERRARVLPRADGEPMALPRCSTPQGQAVLEALMAAQARHGVAAYYARDHLCFLHLCGPCALWAAPWGEEE